MKRIVLAGLLVLAFASASAAGASGNHWCRQGDPPIYASASTSCPFAGRVVSKWFLTCGPVRQCVRNVTSPVTRKQYWITCYFGHRASVNCYGRPGLKISLSFSGIGATT
jgi:hypothetical protein